VKGTAMKKRFRDWYRLTMRKKVGEEWIEKHTWFEVCVYCKNLNGQRRQHRRQSFSFAYYGVSFGKAKDFFDVYRSVSALNRVILTKHDTICRKIAF
jgi:hypothetical protein